jgi:thioesterase domain-containing protein
VEGLTRGLAGDATAGWSPLVPMQAPKSAWEKPPFFWMPGTGGNVIYFHDLARALHGQGIPSHGLQATGLDGASEPAQSVAEIAAINLRALREVVPRGPYYLGGHSFGGYVAFEMARQLEQDGEQVAQLVILDTPAPKMGTVEPAEAGQNEDWLLEIVFVLESLYGRSLGLTRENLAGLEWEAQLERLNERMRATGIMPPGTETREIRGLVNVYCTQARMTYQPPAGAKVSNLVLLRASEVKGAKDEADSALGWETYCSGVVEVKKVPGNHLTMLTGENAKALAATVARHAKEIA